MAHELDRDEQEDVSAPWAWTRYKLAKIFNRTPEEVDDMEVVVSLQALTVDSVSYLADLFRSDLAKLTLEQYEMLTGFLFDDEGG